MADQFLTLMDLKNRLMPGDASIASIAEIISEENPVLDDVPWSQGNLLTGDIFFRRVAKPSSVVRKINEGIEATASKTEAVTETCVELAARGIVDMTELDLAPNAAAYLLTENRPHMASLGEDFAASIFYGGAGNGILGFASRLNSLKNSQVVDGEGTGTNLGSVYCVKWDSNEVTGIYPKNTSAGIKVISKSNEHVPDRDGKMFLAHVTDYKWFVGLKVRDNRYISRLCNLDRDALLTDADARADLFRKMIQLKNKIHHVDKGRVVFYVDSDIYNILEIAAFEKQNAQIAYKGGIQGDTRLLTFSGIPIRKNDCQREAEKKVA